MRGRQPRPFTLPHLSHPLHGPPTQKAVSKGLESHLPLLLCYLSVAVWLLPRHLAKRNWLINADALRNHLNASSLVLQELPLQHVVLDLLHDLVDGSCGGSVLLGQLEMGSVSAEEVYVLSLSSLFEFVNGSDVVSLNSVVKRVHKVRTRLEVEVECQQEVLDHIAHVDVLRLGYLVQVVEELVDSLLLVLVRNLGYHPVVVLHAASVLHPTDLAVH